MMQSQPNQPQPPARPAAGAPTSTGAAGPERRPRRTPPDAARAVPQDERGIFFSQEIA